LRNRIIKDKDNIRGGATPLSPAKKIEQKDVQFFCLPPPPVRGHPVTPRHTITPNPLKGAKTGNVKNKITQDCNMSPVFSSPQRGIIINPGQRPGGNSHNLPALSAPQRGARSVTPGFNPGGMKNIPYTSPLSLRVPKARSALTGMITVEANQ